jgi:uncharacterized repeat protein (TIGR03803 family)
MSEMALYRQQSDFGHRNLSFSEYHFDVTFPVFRPGSGKPHRGRNQMNKSLARSATARAFVFLFVLVAAAGAQTYSILGSFGIDGADVFATPLIDNLGNVFGTTEGGGTGCGSVYELENNGGGGYTNETLHNFTCGADGRNPYGGVVMDSQGNLFGTAWLDGAGGLVYELVNHGGGSYTFEAIHTFAGGPGGRTPVGDLAIFKGNLYGVTETGGGGDCKGNSCGTVYRLTRSGGNWVETLPHAFRDGGDGEWPFAGVAIDSEGNIYGTTFKGGSFGLGTVFKLSPQGSGGYKKTSLHSFAGAADGCTIYSGVVLDSAGNLYGTAVACGADAQGTVYQLKRSGSKYGFRVILTFNGKNGNGPSDQFGHLALDSAGNVYGTAAYGGDYGNGRVFKLTAGSFLYTDLHDFNAEGGDGYTPFGGVTLDSLGNLYGTTFYGGYAGYGTVWEIAKP